MCLVVLGLMYRMCLENHISTGGMERVVYVVYV